MWNHLTGIFPERALFPLQETGQILVRFLRQAVTEFLDILYFRITEVNMFSIAAVWFLRTCRSFHTCFHLHWESQWTREQPLSVAQDHFINKMIFHEYWVHISKMEYSICCLLLCQLTVSSPALISPSYLLLAEASDFLLSRSFNSLNMTWLFES